MMRYLLMLTSLVLIQAKHINNQSTNSDDSPVWKMILEEAQWSGRAGGSLFRNTKTGQFTMFGIGIYEYDENAVDEVWASTNGESFTAVNVKVPCSEQVFSSQDIMDVNGILYRIQGTDWARNDYENVCRSSDGGKTWVDQSDKPRSVPLPSNRYLGAAVSLKTTPETLLIFGGQNGDNLLSDVWRSTDSGISWKYVTDAAFGDISVHAGISTTMQDDGEVLDVVYSIAGYQGYSPKTGSWWYSNDIWVSAASPASIGKTWMKLPLSAPWEERGFVFAGITSTGVLVVYGGVAASKEEYNIPCNDIWASLDGGYSWGICSSEAEYIPRRFTYTTMDSDGYIWMMGGRTEESRYRMSDVWRTVASFQDVNAVASMCNLKIRSCGTGLRCLPNSPGFRYGSWGATCDACPDLAVKEDIMSST